MGRILPSLVPVLTRNLRQEWFHVTPLSSSSPDPRRALLEPWERRGGGGLCLRTSAAPALAPSFHSADCSVLHLCASAAAHAAPPSRLTHRQFGQSSSSSSGRVCNQSGGRWCNNSSSNRKTSQVDLAAAICCSCYCCDNCSRAERYCRQKPVQGDNRARSCFQSSGLPNQQPALAVRASINGCLCSPWDIPASAQI